MVANKGINENKISIAENRISLNENSNNIVSNTGDIEDNRNNIASNSGDIMVNSNNIARLSIRGAQCGYRFVLAFSFTTITYESLLLDTGRGSLDISSGEWRAEEK